MKAEAPTGDDMHAELKSLQGRWKVVRAEQEGKDVRDHLGYDEFLIEGNVSLVQYEGQERKSQFEIDPTKTPKEITYTTSEGVEIRGIYELNGDTWKELLSEAGKERPKNLKNVGFLYEHKRMKSK